MQQLAIHKNVSPDYVEKITMYLQPDGQVVLAMGNQKLAVTQKEAERLIQNRLAHHAMYVQVCRENGDNHV